MIVRQWFAANVLMNPPTRLSEYILAAPSPEIRSVFGKLVVFFCHCAANDDPLSGYDGSNLCEQVLIAVLSLLKGDVADYGKHLQQYFNLFSLYAGLGLHEKQQLIRVSFVLQLYRSVFIVFHVFFLKCVAKRSCHIYESIIR